MDHIETEAAQESQYIEFEREAEEAALLTTLAAEPSSLPGEHYDVMVGTVKVINVCDLMDVLVPGWSGEFGAAAYSKAGAAVMAWVNAHGAHYYAADREDFSQTCAAFEAERAGKRVVVVEDLS